MEPNFTNAVTTALFQKIDHPHIIVHQATLEAEIRSLIAPGEEEKVFNDPSEGICFGGVHKSIGGHFITSTAPTKIGIEYANHVCSILKSPPKKGTYHALPNPTHALSPPNKQLPHLPLNRCFTITLLHLLSLSLMTHISSKSKRRF
jgi:hypothetical protein